MKTETITWRVLPDDGLPDQDVVVLIEWHQPRNTLGNAHGVCDGWLADSGWVDYEGCPIGHHFAEVIAWAPKPVGTRP